MQRLLRDLLISTMRRRLCILRRGQNQNGQNCNATSKCPRSFKASCIASMVRHRLGAEWIELALDSDRKSLNTDFFGRCFKTMKFISRLIIYKNIGTTSYGLSEFRKDRLTLRTISRRALKKLAERRAFSRIDNLTLPAIATIKAR